MKRLILFLFGLGCVIYGSCAAAPCHAQAVVPYQADFVEVAGPRWVDRAGQVWAESAFNPKAVSPVCARGLAQFMPATWREWASPAGSDPFDPAAAIRAQHAYMGWLEARCGGQLEPALGCYNAGLGSIRKAQRLAAALGLPGERAWLQALPRVTGQAHAAETTGYIRHNATFRAAIRRRLSSFPR